MWRTGLLVAVSLLLVGCNTRPPDSTKAPQSNATAADDSSAGSSEITVSVAASTKDAIEVLAAEFQAKEGITVKINAGPSSGLATQIIAGVPAQLFLSANQQWADEVKKHGQSIDEKRLLTNKLVLVVPQGNPAQVKQPADLLSAAVKRVALAGEKVPAGQYADQALIKLDLLAKLSDANKIARGQDVRVTLGYVERGEAEAGIVYSTDVAAAHNIESVYEFPADLHDEIVYVLVLLKDAEKSTAAKAFFDFLSSPQAETQFRRFGFIPLSKSTATP